MVASRTAADTGAMQTARATRVFIVEDSPSIRERLVELLESDVVTVVGEAETPDAAVVGIRQAQPDYVVLDLKLSGGSGIDVLRRLHPDLPEIRFIVLTNHADRQYQRTCERAGASYFLDKSTEFGKVKDLIVGLDTIHS